MERNNRHLGASNVLASICPPSLTRSHLRSAMYESVMSCIYAGIHIAVTATLAEIAGWRWSWNWKVVIMSAWGNTFESVGGGGEEIRLAVLSWRLFSACCGPEIVAQGESRPTWSQTLRADTGEESPNVACLMRLSFMTLNNRCHLVKDHRICWNLI